MLVLRRFLASLGFVAVLAVATPPASAQCGPDGLNGPCCTAAFATIPQIPGLQMDCRSICYNNCNVSQNFLDCINLGPLIPATSGGAVQCGVYDMRFRVKQCGTANFLYNGSMKAFFSRTWEEFPVAGATPIQVWRFIINGDLIPTPLLVGICRRPACTTQYTRVYFSGYIDYAFDCNTGGWKAAFAVTHGCDGIHHRPGTARPAPALGFHATRSFAIVGPGTGFVASTAGPMSDGAITSGSFRMNSWAPAPAAVCTTREPATGSFIAGNQYCFCNTAGSPQFINSTVGAGSACGSAVSPDPNMSFIQMRLGGWNVPTAFPGNEFALFDFGFLRYVNGCPAPAATTEWFEGGETVGGFMAVDLTGVLLDPEFEDLGSCNNSPTSPAIKIGAPHISNFILNFNLP